MEFKCRGKSSGIAVTKAEYWVHKIRGVFYCFKTKTLREKIEQNEYDRVCETAGDAYSFTHLYLFNQNKFIKWGRPLKESI